MARTEPIRRQLTIIAGQLLHRPRLEAVEGRIEENSGVLGMGVYIGKSTKIYNRATGEFRQYRAAGLVVVVQLASADGAA